MKYYKNSKIFDYEHYKSEPSYLKIFHNMLSAFCSVLCVISALLIIFLLFSPSSNNFLFKDGIKTNEIHFLK